MDDNKIVELYWERSETAITVTAQKYGNYCYTISFNILHDDEDAKECVNDTYLNAWKSMPPHKPNHLSAYLGKITRNLSLNRFKKHTTQKRGSGQTEVVLSELEECVPATNDVEKIVEDNILVELIEQFLYAQPKQKRDIFVRRYWYLSPIREISDCYGMSESKVTSLLFRMRNELRLKLEEEGVRL